MSTDYLFSETFPALPQGLIAGVDSGLNGAFVFLSEIDQVLIKVMMPTIKAKTEKGRKLIYDEVGIRDLLIKYRPFHVFVETPQVLPGASRGLISMGVGHGFIRGVCCTLNISYTPIHPRTWQSSMLIGLPKDINTKDKAFIICQRLWPNGGSWYVGQQRNPYSGYCDAALIAEYGKRKLIGK